MWFLFSYKYQILLLYYITKPPLYYLYLFLFFFGCYGQCLGKTSCTLQLSAQLFSIYVISTALFVYISLKIPPIRRKIYSLLGEDWVISKIGNPGELPVVKTLAYPIAGFVVHEASKALDDLGIERRLKASDRTFKQTVDLANQNGTTLSPEVYAQQAERNGRICSAPRRGPFDAVMEQGTKTVEVVSESLGHLRAVTIEALRTTPAVDDRPTSPDPRQ